MTLNVGVHAEPESEARWCAELAGRLLTGDERLVLDIGAGHGPMPVALADRLDRGAHLVAVDASGEALAAISARLAEDLGDRLHLVEHDLDSGLGPLGEQLGTADLVWASASIHHLADQQAGLDALVTLLRPGGRLALAEGGLSDRQLPWDLGLGRPGLQVRLDAANDEWFAAMRAGLPGSVPMPYGWPVALQRAGLGEVTTRTDLLEEPTPLTPDTRESAVAAITHRATRLIEQGRVEAEDTATWRRLLDPADPAWLGGRDDLYWLQARSVHLGRRATSAPL